MKATDAHTTILTRNDAADTASATALKGSPAQRQRAYRLRCKRAAIEAIGEESSASRVALMSLLAQDLAALEDGATPATLIEPRRQSVKRILNVIVTRYAIELSD